MNRILAFILIFLIWPSAQASTCVKDGSVCVDSVPCKIIEGNTVCLADIGSTCWKYEDTFTCVKPASDLQCQPFIDLMPDCWQVNAKCIETNPADGTCEKHEQTWQCNDWQLPTPAYAIKLADTIDYVKNEINKSSCTNFGPNCTVTTETCIEPNETRLINGVSVTKSCWKWQRDYSCTSANSADCIANDSDPTCTLTNTVCASLNPDNSCALYSKTYTCSSNTIDITAANAQCDGGGAPCTTQTVTQPPETWTDGCQETVEANPVTCLRTRDVQVDKDYLYSCKSTNTVNSCDPLIADGCSQSAAPVCTLLDPIAGCLEYDNTYQCADEALPAPNVSLIEVVHTILVDNIVNGCTAQETNQACQGEVQACIEGPETRNINGLDVYKDCWKWESTFTCGTFSSSECSDLIADPYCNLTSTTCVDHLDDDPNKMCLVWDKQFTCSDPSTGGTQQVTTCDDKVTCINGYCFSSGSTADKDFVSTVTWMEIARQAGAYQDPNSLQLFKGTGSQCRVRSMGSCCKVTGAGQKVNSEQYGQSGYGFSITENVAKNAVNFIGSTYVYDALFMSDLVSTNTLSSIYGSSAISGGASFAPGISYMGLTVSWTPAGGFGFSFCAPCMALQLAILVYQQVLSCSMDEQEQILSMRRGANLCTYVGAYCNKKILGWCYERKQAYCCYNSKLAKIINTQGRAQLGMSYGSPQAPDCSGFTPAQLASLDLSAMDMSEFYAEIQPKQLDVQGTIAVVTDNINCKTESGSYFGGTNPLCDKTSKPSLIHETPRMAP